ncbi:MAG: 30S ribosomal protein S17 [Pseudomonadota bacterium]
MPKRILQGTVVSDKNNQTVVVLVERRFTHPLLKKTVRKSKRYHAHDADNKFATGDIVRIEECSPYSKRKRWQVLEKVMVGGAAGAGGASQADAAPEGSA